MSSSTPPRAWAPASGWPCCGADRAMVVSTNDASSLRDAQRTVGAELDFLRQIHLVMNRIQPKLLRQTAHHH